MVEAGLIVPETGKNLPEFLFRYRSLSSSYAWENISESILRSRFFLSLASAVNDPFDVNPIYMPDSIGEINKFLKNTPEKKKTINEYVNRGSQNLVSGKLLRAAAKKKLSGLNHAKLHQKIAKSIFFGLPSHTTLACFSERENCIPMWAHYAENHSGVCIKYRFIPDTDDGDDPIFPISVVYGEKRPTLTTLDLLNFAQIGDKLSDTASLKVFEALCLRKSIDWNYEKEWRVLHHTKIGQGYKMIPCLVASSIVFGIRAKEEDVKMGMDLFSDRIQVFRAHLSKSSYTLDYEKLN